MYAVFQSGGKQHRVSEGQTVRLEKLDIATGETVEFAEVLMIANGKTRLSEVPSPPAPASLRLATPPSKLLW